MDFYSFFIGSYVCVTALFIVMTCIEGYTRYRETGRFFLFGVVLCPAWPVLIVLTIAAQFFIQSKDWRAEADGNVVPDHAGS